MGRLATPFGQGPRFLIRDRDDKYGKAFANVAKGAGVKILKTPKKAPRANAICERFLGSVRRECLDHILILSECGVYRILKAYVDYFNAARPHQEILQQIPTNPKLSKDLNAPIVAMPILGGLHHDYRRAA